MNTATTTSRERFSRNGGKTAGQNATRGFHVRAAHLASLGLALGFPFFLLPAVRAAAPAAATPYTFLGRVMDASRKAFDDKRSAKIEAYNADGERLASVETFFRSDSRRNYALAVPMSTSEADKYAVQDEALELVVTDDLGNVWRGVVVDAAAGAPGAVREADIVLGVDSDGDGIDDALYARLQREWENSEWWQPGETFDPKKDYDGDGVPTLSEALSGTDPFAPDAVLKITAFTRRAPDGNAETAALTFNAADGRAYFVEEATDLKAKDWKRKTFSTEAGGAPVNYLSRPSDNKPPLPYTVYLLPSNSTNVFYRVKCE